MNICMSTILRNTSPNHISAYCGSMLPSLLAGIREKRHLGSLWVDRNGTDLFERSKQLVMDKASSIRKQGAFLPAIASMELGSVDAEKKAVQFGAGAIGRGFLAPIIAQAGFRISFLDADQTLIDTLRSSDCYYVNMSGRERTISDLHLLNSVTQREYAVAEVIRASMITTSVGPKILPMIAPTIADGVFRRMLFGIENNLNIMFLENMPVTPVNDFRGIEDQLAEFRTSFFDAASSMFFNHIQESQFANYVEKHIGMARAIGHYPTGLIMGDPLNISVAGHGHFIPVDAKGFKGRRTGIPQMKLSQGYDALAMQKLFAFNMTHALVAYLGFVNGALRTDKAMEVPEIRTIFEGAMSEIESALTRQFGFSEAQTAVYRSHTTSIFEEYQDSVFRVGGDPFRKLAPNDRMIGAARLCLMTGVRPENIAKGIAAGIFYAINVSPDNDKTVSIPRDVTEPEDKLQYMLQVVCGLTPDDRLYSMVLDSYREIAKSRS